ncbi:MAG: hypothetical protein JXR03_06170 [Cyclobacteriaceae bacterium]
MPKTLFLLITLASLLSCDQLKKQTEKALESENPNVVKKYHENGKIKTYYEINELKQRHGNAWFYNKKGIVTKSFVYDNGEKVKAFQYYENGKPLMEINYKNEVKDGPVKRFYENGQVESEIMYADNQPGKGLKEFSKSGKPRTKYPSLVIKPIDQLKKNGKYIIQVFFDNQPGRGNYYMGKLTDGIYMHGGLSKLPESNYRGQFTIEPAPGVMLMEKLYFVGEFKTPTGNKYIVEESFNLAIDTTY